MKNLAMFFCFLFFCNLKAFAQDTAENKCSFLEKSNEARELLKESGVGFRRANKKISSVIVSRDILLVVSDKNCQKIKLVRLEVNALSRNRFEFKVITSGYNVERISGAGITRLIFKVTDKDTGEELIVWDSRHLHLEKQRTSPRDLFYFPYSDAFLSQDIIDLGTVNLFEIMEKSKAELCATGTKSKAYPDKLLCEVIPDLWLATLGAIEQTDDADFFSDNQKAISKFLIHVARNKENAFYYSVSADGARGLMQFMNSRRIDTYNDVKRRYPAVKLISDFEKGTADMKNSIKAAICLADLNLSSLPIRARDLFLKNPNIGGTFIAAAHNGGAGRARTLWREFERGTINFSNFKTTRRVLLKETENFVNKYLVFWKILESR